MSNENSEQAPLLYWSDYFGEEAPPEREKHAQGSYLLVVTMFSCFLWALIGFGLYLLFGN